MMPAGGATAPPVVETTTTTGSGSGSAIVLNVVDDFVSPSAACVNPLFVGGGTDPTRAAASSSGTTTTTPTSSSSHGVVPRQKGRLRRRTQTIPSTEEKPNPKNNDKATIPTATTTAPANHKNAPSTLVTARLSDCLACSGCITTAETVLLQEQHSLTVLQQQIIRNQPPEAETVSSSSWTPPPQARRRIVVTISPASWADLARYCGSCGCWDDDQNNNNNNNNNHESFGSLPLFQQTWTALLHRYLHASAVLDGNVPLQISRHAAAEEFLRAYRQARRSQPPEPPSQAIQNNNNNDTFPSYYDDWEGTVPSVARSATETQFFPTTPATAAATPPPTVPVHQPRRQQCLPLISATCPAIVCLVEKSTATTTTTTTTTTQSSSSHQGRAAHAPESKNGTIPESALSSSSVVSHLSTVPSPMTVAAQFWRDTTTTTTTTTTITAAPTPSTHKNNTTTMTLFHLAVMPCHDKKLEASRPDFVRTTAGGEPPHKDVDAVVTTLELVQLLLEEVAFVSSVDDDNDNNSSNNNNTGNRIPNETTQNAGTQQQQLLLRDVILRQQSEGLSHVVVKYVGRDNSNNKNRQDSSSAYDNDDDPMDPAPILWTLPPEQLQQQQQLDPPSHFPNNNNNNTNDFFALGAGGYADSIFRRAATELFGVDLLVSRAATAVWRPVPAWVSSSSTSLRLRSARTAQRRREYYEAVLVRCRDTGRCRVLGPSEDDDNDDNHNTTADDVVLRFAIAYGMQTVQTALFQQRHRYDYLEAMACPNGACLNGGGQIVSSSLSSSGHRETPTEMRQRVQATRQHFVALSHSAVTTTTATEPPTLRYYTRYHVVPVMQHSLGAAAGVKVQDTQW